MTDEARHILEPNDQPHFTYNIRSSLWRMVLKGCDPQDAGGIVSVPYVGRPSDSPFIDMIWHGRSESNVTPCFPADVLWYMRLLKRDGKISLTLRGPTTKAVPICYRDGDEFIGVRFKIGNFMPHLHTSNFVDGELILPEATSKSFWLHGSAWEFPRPDNADVFVERLIREGLLVLDPVVKAALQGSPPEKSIRAVQYRFLRVTGFTHSAIQQIERSRHAAALLAQGRSILETVYEAGYADQPHLTRALRRFVGLTPAQILRVSEPA